MPDLLHPNLLWTLALAPVVLALVAWAAFRRGQAARRVGDADLLARLTRSVSLRRRRYKGALVVAAALLLSVALVGPRYGTAVREVEREGLDLMVALDVSRSMLAEDVAPSRLDRAKREIEKLLPHLRGDRIGLVLFAGDAFVQCPLTTDQSAFRLFLDIAGPDQIPTPGTDFDVAIDRALAALQSGATDEVLADEARARALLIVSDGENHIPDLEATLERAREAGLALFAAGVGETEGAEIPLYRGQRRVGVQRDRQGAVVQTRLEEDVLRRIAGDGHYFRISRGGSDLSNLPAQLDRLDRSAFASEQFSTYAEQFQLPLALAVALLLIDLLLPVTRRPRPDRSLVSRLLRRPANA
jgi:Ca-activated chloride channel family protein